MGAIWVLAMLVGAASEWGAARLRLWVYRRPVFRVVNVVGMFGLVMGSVAAFAPALGLGGMFALGFALGLAYEAANLAWLDWWRFPGGRLLGLEGNRACAVALSVAWGMVPVAVAILRGYA